MSSTNPDSLAAYHDMRLTSTCQVDRFLPGEQDLDSLFRSEEKNVVLPLLKRILIEPLEEFTARPSKILRAALVHAGYDIAVCRNAVQRQDRGTDSDLALCANIIELLHAGSLIVDDWQDESWTRRGKPCFHRLYGASLAVTAGNLLYMWPLNLIDRLAVSPDQARLMRERYQKTMEVAHYGQALDIAVSIDELPQQDISALCRWVTRHKSGTLTALALEMGAILGGAEAQVLTSLERFGSEFGCVLQNYDDIANVLGHRETAKQFEDLLLRRPSWVWALVADHYDAVGFSEFCQAVRELPTDTRPLTAWLRDHRFAELASQRTQLKLNALMQRIANEFGAWDPTIQKILTELCERLSHVYAQQLEDSSGHR
jgi:geranylgeranyl pyrophosphate synthase